MSTFAAPAVLSPVPTAGVRSTRATVWIVVRLKLVLLRNSFRGETSRRVGAYLGLVVSLAMAGVGFLVFLKAGHRAEPGRTRSIVTGATVVFCAWVFGPLLRGGVDDSVDPTRLALLPLSRRELRFGLLAAALVGTVPLGTVAALAGAVVGFAPAGPGAVLVVGALAFLVLLSLSAARALSVTLARAARSRRGRDLAVLVASLGGALLWLGAQSVRVMGDRELDTAIRVLRWLPPGALAQAVLDASAGRHGASLVRIIAVVPLAVLLMRAWMSGLDRLLVEPESLRERRRVARRDGVPVLGRLAAVLPDGPTGAIVAKELRYLGRSPQRRAALIISTIIGTVFAVLQVLRGSGVSPGSVYLASVALLFGAGTTNNLMGADAASLWLESSAAVPMRRLLLGRGVAAIPTVVSPVVVSAVALTLLSGGWHEGILVVALACVGWGIPLGVGSIVSVYAPFAQPDLGNPYSNRQVASGQGLLIGLLGIGGLFGITLFGLPVILGVGLLHGAGAPAQVALVGGTGLYAVGVWLVGLGLAGRRADRREPELVDGLGRRRANA